MLARAARSFSKDSPHSPANSISSAKSAPKASCLASNSPSMAIPSSPRLCARVCSSTALTTLPCASSRLSSLPVRRSVNFSVCSNSFSQKLPNPFPPLPRHPPHLRGASRNPRQGENDDYYHARSPYFFIERSPHRRRVESRAHARTPASLRRHKSSPCPLRFYAARQVHRPHFREAVAAHPCHLRSRHPEHGWLRDLSRPH